MVTDPADWLDSRPLEEPDDSPLEAEPLDSPPEAEPLDSPPVVVELEEPCASPAGDVLDVSVPAPCAAVTRSRVVDLLAAVWVLFDVALPLDAAVDAPAAAAALRLAAATRAGSWPDASWA